MKQTLPYWRIDNIAPLAGMIVALIVNIGAIFWWGGRTDLKMEQVIVSQADLSRDLKDWKKQVETRLGQEEKNSVLFANVLKLNIK